MSDVAPHPGPTTTQVERKAFQSFMARHKELIVSVGTLALAVFTGWLTYRDMLLDAHARAAANGERVDAVAAVVLADPKDPTRPSLVERVARLEREEQRHAAQRVEDHSRRVEEYRAVMARLDKLGEQIMSLREDVAGMRAGGAGK